VIYVEGEHEKGFIHTNYNIHTARTGRLTSYNPNLQTVPNPSHDVNLRHYFIPPRKDWVVWEFDFKALEMKVVAHLSRDKVMIKELQDGIDMHCSNAVRFGHVFGTLAKSVKYDEFKKIRDFKPEDGYELGSDKETDRLISLSEFYDELRRLAKSIGFGISYGKNAITFAKETGKDVEDIEVALDTYFEGYCGLFKWREKQKKTSVQVGLLELPWTDYYANERAMYEQTPHELLYWAYGWLGNISKAQEHLKEAKKYQPKNPHN